MGIEVIKNLVHWNYYLALEQDLSKVSRFIEFSKSNFDCYSIELAHLLLASSSEVDVVLKSLCNLYEKDSKHENINHYKKTILKHIPEFSEEICTVNRFGLYLQPWTNWAEKKNPYWWKAHTNVKHHREKKFSEANLKNTLNSVAGLYICVLFYYKKLFENQVQSNLDMRDVTIKLIPEPSLLRVGENYYYQHLVG